MALLGGETSIELVAGQGAERALAFLAPDPMSPAPGLLHRNSVVHGVLRGRVAAPGGRELPPKYVSVIVGLKELKWNVYEIFDRPGLRRDIMLVQASSSRLCASASHPVSTFM